MKPKARNLTAESWHSYKKGGLHPTVIGDRFDNDRFEVIRKLGYGSYSTVWLAKDARQGNYVALKILKADAALAERELQVMHELKVNQDQENGSDHVLLIRETFLRVPMVYTRYDITDRPTCLAFPPMGPSVGSLAHESDVLELPFEVEDGYRLPLSLAKSIILQVLQGLQFMHHNGVVHGDVQPGNMLSTLNNLASVDPQLLMQQDKDNCSTPLDATNSRPNQNGHTSSSSEKDQKSQPVIASDNHAVSHASDNKFDSSSAADNEGLQPRVVLPQAMKTIPDHSPDHLTISEPLDIFSNLQPDTMNVKLSDFGNSFFANDAPTHKDAPLALRSPELVVDKVLTKGQDIWAFGCLAWELVVGLPLFPVFIMPFAPSKKLDPHWAGPGPDPQDTGPDDDHMLSFTEIVGPIPKEIRDRWPRSKFYFDDDGKIINHWISEDGPAVDDEYDPCQPLREALWNRKSDEMSVKDAQGLCDLLEKIFQYDPRDRPSMEEIAADPWILDIASSMRHK